MLKRTLLIVAGLIATALAFAGAILPGLPTTPFLLVALWAFARSSNRLYGWLHSVPLLKTGLVEAQRFEEHGTVRLPVKIIALSFAWGSVLATWLFTGLDRPVLLAVVTVAALAATAFMLWIPTDQA